MKASLLKRNALPALVLIGCGVALTINITYRWREDASAESTPLPRTEHPFWATVLRPDTAEGFLPSVVMEPFRPITEFKILPASDVQDQIRADDLVLGVTIDGASRAYPLNTLTGPAREILNDSLGGSAIAATW